MKLDDFLVKHITGEKFSSGARFQFADDKYKGSRISVITDIVREVGNDSNIIHLGCCDHIELIDRKIAEGRWLHKSLMEASKNVVGFDINKEAIEYVRNIGYNNVHFADIISEKDIAKRYLEQENIKQKWDYLIAGEIIEHVDNPTLFLSEIKKQYKDTIDKIIVTVPNAFSLQNIKFALVGQECINTDHRFWFTPYTISKILYQAGITVEEIYFADRPSKKELDELGIENKDLFAITLVVVGKL